MKVLLFFQYHIQILYQVNFKSLNIKFIDLFSDFVKPNNEIYIKISFLSTLPTNSLVILLTLKKNFFVIQQLDSKKIIFIIYS